MRSNNMKRFDQVVPEELHERFTKELEEWNIDQENRVGWVCRHCGESTYETDYDNLISPGLHIHCLAIMEKNENRKNDSTESDI